MKSFKVAGFSPWPMCRKSGAKAQTSQRLYVTAEAVTHKICFKQPKLPA
jgi:hypothetical protein